MLLDLQRLGHVHYIGWKIGFYCQTLLVDAIQGEAKNMEDELERWNKDVAEARERFYELNYFTTCQLLTLRNELGKFKPEQPAQIHLQPQVIALLKSLSSAITPSLPVHLLQHVTKQLSNTGEVKPAGGSERVKKPHKVTAQSENSSISSSAIASTLVLKEKPRLSVVALSKESLNDRQKDYVTDIMENFFYSENTAVKIIKEVGDGGDWNDIENWLRENGGTLEDEEMVDDKPNENNMSEQSEVENDEEENEADINFQELNVPSEFVVYDCDFHATSITNDGVPNYTIMSIHISPTPKVKAALGATLTYDPVIGERADFYCIYVYLFYN